MDNYTQTYTVIVWAADEGGYWAEVVELPGCVSQGETKEELRWNIVEAIEACLEAGAEPGYNDESGEPEMWRVPVAGGAAP